MVYRRIARLPATTAPLMGDRISIALSISKESAKFLPFGWDGQRKERGLYSYRIVGGQDNAEASSSFGVFCVC